jgi:3-deoxy-D-manno-octulosonic-acid transferase
MKSSITSRFWRGLYSALMTIAIPLLFMRLWWKGRKNPEYRLRWQERLAIFNRSSLQQKSIWVHAVSLGEAVAAIPLIRGLQKQYPDTPLVVTTTTPTGSQMIQNTFKESVLHVYFPYDLPSIIHRFLDHFKPKILVLLETELWLHCLECTKRRNIPIVTVNGRISPKALGRYECILPITRLMLSCVTVVAAQSEQDGERFIKLGLPKERLVVTGNIKFDVPVKEDQIKQGEALKAQWNRPVWVAASTHAGEEEQVLGAFKIILTEVKDALLILVPRHPERFDAVNNLILNQGFSVVTRKSEAPVLVETAVFLGDTMGELNLFYAASDLAFVGGSLIPIGGHNALEAAVLGIPVIMGPHTQNCVEITKLLSEASALVQISSSETLARAVIRWFKDPAERKRLGSQGKTVVEKNRGALNKMMRLIEEQL